MADEPVKKRPPGRPKGSTKEKSADRNLVKARPKTAKARLEEYVRTLPKITLNDITLLENMVAIEMEMDRLRKLMPTAKEGLEARKISEALTNYSKEYRLIQDALGIGRNQRSTEIDMQKEIDALVADSDALVAKVGVWITCTACVSDFEMGTIIFHFRDNVPWLWVFACPRCGTIIQQAGLHAFPREMTYESERELIGAGDNAGDLAAVGGDAPDRDRDIIGQPGALPGPVIPA